VNTVEENIFKKSL
jgi:hypothetical protein